MWILMMEAGAALFLLVFIVWWTMFSDQQPSTHEQDGQAAPDDADTGDAPGR